MNRKQKAKSKIIQRMALIKIDKELCAYYSNKGDKSSCNAIIKKIPNHRRCLDGRLMAMKRFSDDSWLPSGAQVEKRAKTMRPNFKEICSGSIDIPDSIVKAYQDKLEENHYSIIALRPESEKPPIKKKYKVKTKGDGFYKSRAWKRLRYEALVMHGRRCMCCGATPKQGIILHVDHIKPRSLYPGLELSLDNLQVLCEDCNLGKSNLDESDFRNEIKK